MCARALYRRTPLLILDEPTSRMDPRGEHQVCLVGGGFALVAQFPGRLGRSSRLRAAVTAVWCHEEPCTAVCCRAPRGRDG